jgi:PAS domain S-box-containing protein
VKTEIATAKSIPPGFAWRWLVLPVFAVAALTLVFIWSIGLVEVSFENRVVTLLLNTLLVTGVSAWVATLALRGYLASGLPEMLYAGCGFVAMGSSFLLAGLVIGGAQGPNDAVTVHNLGVFCASFFHLAAALRAGQPRAGKPAPNAFGAASAYLAVLALTGFFWAGAQYDLAPAFYIPGKGTTPVRQLVLTVSVAVLAVAAAFLIRHAARRGSLSLRCYGLGLGLIAMGLVDVSIAVPGSILSWTGRLSQGIGHLYLLAAFMIAIRTAVNKGLDVREAAADYYLESEEHYRALVKALRSAVISLDPRERVVLWNPQAEAISGYSDAEAAGRPLTDLLAPEGDGREAFRNALKERSGRYLELTLRRKDGAEFPADVLVLAAGGGWTKWTNLIIRETSDRKQAEEALREGIRRYELVVTGAHAAIWDWDVVRKRVFFSPQWKALRGFSENEVTDSEEEWAGRIHPEDASRVFAAVQAHFEGRTAVFAEEYRTRCKDGSWKWIFDRGLALRDDAGRVVRMAGSETDISERKEAEDELRKSEARFRLLADTAEQLLTTGDPQGHVRDLAGRVMAHLDCHCFFNFLVVNEELGRLRLNAWAGIPEEEARRIEYLDYGVAVCGCVARDGRRIVAERIPSTPDVRTDLVKSYGIKAYACHPLTGMDGRVLGTLSFGTRSRETFRADDLALMKAVTDQVAVAMVRMQNELALRSSEEALRKANEELEKTVRKRTLELEGTVTTLKNEIVVRKKVQTQLHQLSRKSMEALEADRRSVARELHDSIGGSLAAIKFGLEEAAEQAAKKPNCEAVGLEALVGHLADTIKETKRISANLRPLMLDDLGMLATIDWYTRQFNQRYGDIRLIRQIDLQEHDVPEEYKIVVFRVMQEAVTNAARHSRADTICIRLKKAATRLELDVEDNGCGFNLSEIFSREDRFSGFGLKSMQERAEICGGVLDFHSQPGEGTCVRLILPVTEKSTDSGTD